MMIIQSPQSMSVSCMLDLMFFMFFYKREGMSNRDVDVLLTVFPPLVLVEKSVVKLLVSEAAILG